ncbi:MAG: flagellar protein export ATPase FliI [Rickettsiales bacterium]|nr:flagellar protein export ATPase FliI [Rickettsiales bacterium]
MTSSAIERFRNDLDRLQNFQVTGKITAVKGLLAECTGIEQILQIGSRCRIKPQGRGHDVLAEVVGFRDNAALLMPFHSLEGIGPGATVTVEQKESTVRPSNAWLGRVVDAMGNPIDDKGPVPVGPHEYLLRATPPMASRRTRIGGKLDLGIRVLNSFLTCCVGQRMGIFAGSGVGKSIMMSMLARYSTADVNVIGLVGERGREVQEFIEDDLGEEGLARSVVVVATSSESALMRRQAAYLTMTLSEFYREQGKNVLTLMDSVTRFAMAQREIGLSAGEPPTSKGYTPTVFSELPKLLERAGPGMEGEGSITGLFSVLVEGDDTNEPISDAVRGILDGHIVMNRDIAVRGRYPAVDVLKSVSRMMPDCNSNAENNLIQLARTLINTYEDMAEMIRLGAYRRGSDREVDRAIQYYPLLEDYLRQRKQESTNLGDGYDRLADVLGLENWREALEDIGKETA